MATARGIMATGKAKTDACVGAYVRFLLRFPRAIVCSFIVVALALSLYLVLDNRLVSPSRTWIVFSLT